MIRKELSSAEKVLLELQSNYLLELPSKLDEIEGYILALKRQPNLEEEFLDLLRTVHSLKGSAGTYSYHIISSVCHRMEDSLKHVADDRSMLTDRYISIWLDYVDLLRQTVELLQQKVDKFSAIEDRLHDLDIKLHKNDLRCLIVEPSKSAALLYKSALSGLPVTCVVESNGIKALESILDGRVDVLITGVEVPQLTGPVIIAAARMSGHQEQLESVMITSRDRLLLEKIQQPDYLLMKGSGLVATLHDTMKEIVQKK